MILNTEESLTSRRKRKIDSPETVAETAEESEAPKKKRGKIGFIDFQAPLVEQPPITAFISMVQNVFSGVFNVMKAVFFESSRPPESSDVLVHGKCVRSYI